MSISSLIITTKGKTITGKVMPKQKAEEKYVAAKTQGNVGFLAKEDKPQTISIQIGKIDPKEEIKVEIQFDMLNRIVDESW